VATKTILMHGWRFVPHSFAVVCQFWLLEMLKRPELRVFHIDAPYYKPHWKPVFDQLDATRERALRQIPEPGDDTEIDVEIRLDFPYDFSPSRARPLPGLRSWPAKACRQDSKPGHEIGGAPYGFSLSAPRPPTRRSRTPRTSGRRCSNGV
jgi:hypothetical protein